MFNKSEDKHYFMAKIKFFLQKARNIVLKQRRLHGDTNIIVLRSYSYAIQDAMKYMNIGLDDFYCYADKWNKHEMMLFEENDLAAFYQSWNQEFAHYNICANIINQHREIVNFDTILKTFPKQGTYVDYGCGTAALSLGLFLGKTLSGNLLLLDVNNDVRRFVDYRIKKHELADSVKFHDVFAFQDHEICDGLICIDVLEHLENATEIFVKKIHPLVKMGGVIYLRAPWRGQLTHIDEAADDFYLNGGRKFLAEKYIEVYRNSTIDISCVYKKIKR